MFENLCSFWMRSLKYHRGGLYNFSQGKLVDTKFIVRIEGLLR